MLPGHDLSFDVAQSVNNRLFERLDAFGNIEMGDTSPFLRLFTAEGLDEMPRPLQKLLTHFPRQGMYTIMLDIMSTYAV